MGALLYNRYLVDLSKGLRISEQLSHPRHPRMSRLSILQYNVRKSKKVMEPLLADSAVASYDIIAIQEPWKNPQMNRTYCPAAAGYYSAYDDIEQRCCFLVNKNLDISI